MNCKNCVISIQTHHNYCPHCGAKVIRKRLTIKALLSHFSEQFLNYDNKFLQSFIKLFTLPEEVIGCYISGTRKKYVNVISYFALAVTIAGLQLYILNKYFPELVNLNSITAQGQEEFNKKTLDFIQEYQSILMIIYVPFYAVISKIVFYNIKTYNYTEHLVIYMYIFAQITIFGSLFQIACAFFGLSIGTSSMVLLPIQMIYSGYCLKRIFNLNLKRLILKTLFFLLLLFLLFILFVIVFLLILYLNGGIEELREAQNQSKQLTLNNFFFHKLYLV